MLLYQHLSLPKKEKMCFLVSAFRLNDDATSNGFFTAWFDKVSPRILFCPLTSAAVHRIICFTFVCLFADENRTFDACDFIWRNISTDDKGTTMGKYSFSFDETPPRLLYRFVGKQLSKKEGEITPSLPQTLSLHKVLMGHFEGFFTFIVPLKVSLVYTILLYFLTNKCSEIK